LIPTHKKVLIIGDIMLDTYVKGEHHRMSPEADCPILNQTNIEHRLGGAANVALNLLHLGQNPILIGLIGDDKNGHTLKSKCQNEDINYHLFLDKDRPTTSKKRFIDDTYKQYLRVDDEWTNDIAGDLEKEVLHYLDSFDFSDIELIIIQDYNKGFLTEKIINKIQIISDTHSIKLCVDPKHNHFQLLSQCDLFKPNLSELSKYLKAELNPRFDEIDSAISNSTLNQKNDIIVTLSEAGIYYKSEAESGIINGQNIENADVSGAGDTVIAILGLLLISGLPIKKTAFIANKCGAKVCQMKGISTIKLTDLQDIMELNV